MVSVSRKLDHCGLGQLSGDSSQVSNEISASHVGGNNEHNNDVDVEMNTQIDVGVIETVGTGALEAVATGGGVLAFDVGGGGGVVPLVAEAARGKVDEPAKEVIDSIVGGFTAEAMEGMVVAPTAPQVGGARGASGGEGLCMHDFDTILNDRVQNTIIQAQERTVTYDLNMAIYSSFAEISCCLGEGIGKAPEKLIYNISKSKMSFAEQNVYLELLNTWLRNNKKCCEIKMEKVMKEKEPG
ncbi:hypothetical protein SELMODRAFT_432135 [Selaginella moellendorffii]|uniref:Uncharacterized protein n=1 Tax=Selaginella moellendorffii TaxID=88036 RepID=D8TF31_SELML|nr:hypothetical protein SELMODRAFT_432135 [Selaginella moellendorffii]